MSAYQPSRLYINSLFGNDENAESPSKFRVQLPTSIQNVSEIELNTLSCVFTPLQPNISPYENTLYLLVDASNISVTVDDTAVYNSPQDLCAELNTQLSSFSVGSFSFNSRYARIEFTPAASVTQYQVKTGSNAINRRLGFAKQADESTIQTGVFRLPCPPILIRTTQLLLESKEMARAGVTADVNVSTNIVSAINMTSGSYGALINFQLTNDVERSTSVSDNFQFIEIQLLDDQYKPLQLSLNSQVNIEVKLQYNSLGNDRPVPAYTYANRF